MPVVIGLLWGCGIKAPTLTLGTMEPLPLVRTSIDRRWYVPVAVNDAPWVWFVDTGYAMTTCDDDLADELELHGAHARALTGAAR